MDCSLQFLIIGATVAVVGGCSHIHTHTHTTFRRVPCCFYFRYCSRFTIDSGCFRCSCLTHSVRGCSYLCSLRSVQTQHQKAEVVRVVCNSCVDLRLCAGCASQNTSSTRSYLLIALVALGGYKTIISHRYPRTETSKKKRISG